MNTGDCWHVPQMLFKPQPDITAWELARLLQWTFSPPSCSEFDLNPDLHRHCQLLEPRKCKSEEAKNTETDFNGGAGTQLDGVAPEK